MNIPLKQQLNQNKPDKETGANKQNNSSLLNNALALAGVAVPSMISPMPFKPHHFKALNEITTKNNKEEKGRCHIL